MSELGLKKAKLFGTEDLFFRRWREGVMVVLVFTWIGSIFALFPAPAAPHFPAWPDGLLLGCGAVAAMLFLAGYLPWQNVLSVMAIAFVLAGCGFGTVAHPDFPGPRLVFDPKMGPGVFGRLPLTMFPLWMVVFFSARGVARLILHPRRQRANYGIWLLGLTTLLVLCLAMGLEAMATQVKHFWHWEGMGSQWGWRGLVWPALILWGFTALVIQLVGLPWLVSKKPAAPPPDFQPLLLWGLLNLWILAGTATRGLLVAAAITLATTIVAVALAMRGGISGKRV